MKGLLIGLKYVGLDIVDLDQLKRTDLSERKLDFEIVYDDLSAAYELLRGILMSSRDALLGLSNDDVEKIRTSLDQFWETIDTITSVSLSTSKDRYKEIFAANFFAFVMKLSSSWDRWQFIWRQRKPDNLIHRRLNDSKPRLGILPMKFWKVLRKRTVYCTNQQDRT